MKNNIVIYVENGVCDEDLFFLKEFVPEKLTASLSEIDKISGVCYSLPADYTGKLKDHKSSFIRDTKHELNNWKVIFDKTGSDNLIKVYADSPFVDNVLISEMLDTHLESLAEFTYSENVPQGLSSEIFSSELINNLPESDEKMIPLEKVIKSNINQFDVELYYKSPDIRDKRLSFRSSDKRNNLIMSSLFKLQDNIPPYEKIKELIESNPNVLYVGPSYLEIEVTGRSELEAIYGYHEVLAEERSDMGLDVFEKIIADANQFELPYAVCLGGSGDPLCHAEFYKLLEISLAERLINNIIIETGGTLIDDNFIQFIKNANDSRIKVIVDISGYDKNTYLEIHQKDCFSLVESNLLKLRDVLDDKNEQLYIQVMKINETEKFLDQYYDYWEPKNIPIILQKQNTYLGLVEDRRYYDLSPLDRTPCWHLQRDLFILANGEVAFCKQDVNGKNVSGNVANQSLIDLWKSRENIFLEDFQANYCKNPDCSACDEWYTFNL
jgi:spiro-SPASM protein